jgi:hypothetical protein
VPLPHDEPEILDGARAWPEAQAALRGVIDPNRRRWETEAYWYDTAINEHEGAFCMVQAGSEMEDLIGDVVEVRYLDKTIYVYCVGAADLATDYALARTAFFWIELLDRDQISVGVQPVVRS